MFKVVAAASIIAILPNISANAASYNFNVLYNGSTASLAGGSDDPRTVILASGDTFLYTLKSTNGYWTTIGDKVVFPAFALAQYADGTAGQSTADLTFQLLNHGVPVFSSIESAVQTCCAHIGTNKESYPVGLKFNEFSLFESLTSTQNTAKAASLLPYGGAPEVFSPFALTYTMGAAAPEPGSWALMLIGFAALATMGYRVSCKETATAN